jgi:hypothetical protein
MLWVEGNGHLQAVLPESVGFEMVEYSFLQELGYSWGLDLSPSII